MVVSHGFESWEKNNERVNTALGSWCLDVKWWMLNSLSSNLGIYQQFGEGVIQNMGEMSDEHQSMGVGKWRIKSS